MKAAVFSGTPGVEIREVPTPTPAPGEALIEVDSVGVCGGDVFITSGNNPRVKPPLIPGHEVVGTIRNITEEAGSHYQAKDRVAVVPNQTCGICDPCQQGNAHLCTALQVLGAQRDGGYAEYMLVPLDNLIAIPEHVAFKDAVLIEPIAVAVHAVRRSSIEIGDTAVVIGAGPIGLFTAQVARISGCSRVILVDLLQERLTISEKMGFTVINGSQGDPVEHVLQLTSGQGADIVYECVGHAGTIPQVTAMCRPRGQIVVVGLFKEPAPTDWFRIQRFEQRLTGAWMYARDDFARSLALLENGLINLEGAVSHRLSLNEAQTGIDLVKNGRDAMKVILQIADR